MSEASPMDRPAPHVLAKVRTGSGLSWDGFAVRVSEAGFAVSGRRVRAYEEGSTKRIPLEYVEAVCSAFGTSPGVFFSQGASGDVIPSETEAERQLAAVRKVLEGDEPSLQSSSRTPHDPGSLRRRFLAAISDYSDLEVERICSLNHETVRQYRQGQWPKRGPNAASQVKMERFLELHEQRRTAAATEAGELPPLSEGLISFAEEWKQDQEFSKEYPNQGWISITNHAVRTLRLLGLMRYDDEIAWLAYKRAMGYDPESADDVTLDNVGLSIDPLANLARQDREGESYDLESDK